MRAVAIAILFVALVSWSSAASAESGTGIDALNHKMMLVGNKLKLLVDTYKWDYPFWSHSPTSSDTKTYFVETDLSTDKPLIERTQVVGPLWSVPGDRSLISFQSGANFTDKDVRAARATPWCHFDSDGNFVRFARREDSDELKCDQLVVSADGASWKHCPDVRAVPDHLRPMSTDRVLTPSGRFDLFRSEGSSVLFDVFAGERKDDPWLTECFTNARSIKNFNNVRILLTEDLNYLVVSPAYIWNTGHGDIKTFDFEGKTYNRGDWGLAYGRPNSAPILYARKPEERQAIISPNGALSIDGQLYLFLYSPQSLCLYSPAGRKEFRYEDKDKQLWKNGYHQMQHLPASNELALFEISLGRERELTVSVIRWNYRTNNLVRYEARISDLFERHLNRLRPKAAVRVKLADVTAQ